MSHQESPRQAERLREGRRQSALVEAIFAPRVDASSQAFAELRETGARADRGLSAYRANAEALAERALGAAFANVRTMLGTEDFAHLAAEYWRAEPPQRGDVGEWGQGFADWIDAHSQLGAWPYLADCARLEYALHRNERAADADFDVDSLALLSQADPPELRIELMPGSALIESAWPIVSIHRAHVGGDEADFAAVREAVGARVAQRAFVFRSGWRATVAEVDEAGAAWTRAVLDGADLANALDRAGESFDFAAWLAEALAQRWLKGVVRAVD